MTSGFDHLKIAFVYDSLHFRLVPQTLKRKIHTTFYKFLSNTTMFEVRCHEGSVPTPLRHMRIGEYD
ncbi:unnamed protein product [Amoebophrya sp. A25]|nr:unnamed protein product [Amoebophrya sp. A25]|eukprot:GSA25T00013077001.1